MLLRHRIHHFSRIQDKLSGHFCPLLETNPLVEIYRLEDVEKGKKKQKLKLNKFSFFDKNQISDKSVNELVSVI
jgi:hypothetical protein